MGFEKVSVNLLPAKWPTPRPEPTSAGVRGTPCAGLLGSCSQRFSSQRDQEASGWWAHLRPKLASPSDFALRGKRHRMKRKGGTRCLDASQMSPTELFTVFHIILHK